MSPRSIGTVTLGLVLSTAALVVAPAAASDDEVDRGACDGQSNYRLRAFNDDNGRITAVATLYSADGSDNSEENDVWEWRLVHNGDLSAKGETRANDDDAHVRSFRIERSMVDFYGPEQIVFRMESKRTGEVCRGEIDL